ncbi:hypothetical protein CHS0354_000480 [Potamilus streckersoni]|uniref:Uncharacterized protein n=1 Tax=Potamilus streckersoni TaxID=2493646 RepID=A0AAE0T7E4_9BIVA|nr:hypothetical protein CHS0354_000480 [Potamilus streckersoni]
MSESKNDLAWEKIFEKHRILDMISKDGYYKILATQINEFREARLMTKFDHKSQLPKLFANNRLSVLPTSRGGYVIGEFETFCNFNTDDDIEVSPIEFPTFLESLDYSDITSEATVINCAFVSKILHNFTEEENLFPTVSGRMRSSSFSFNIKSSKGPFNVYVENSQVEIDGGYEGDNSLCLIEAKNYISDDFLVRQLYYPYRLWSGKIKKQVRPIFLTYSNGVFHLREYRFSNAEHYNSLVCIKQRKYIVQEGGFNNEELSQIINTTETIKEPEIPFPQADNFERVINLCELLKQKEFISKEDITQNYDFDARQTDYYSNAGKYLGIIDTGKDSLTGQKDAFSELYDKLQEGRGEYEGANPEDADEYLAHNIFFVPEEARWQFLQDRAKQPTIGKLIDDAMDAIEKLNSSLKGVLPKIYADPELNKQRLGRTY